MWRNKIKIIVLLWSFCFVFSVSAEPIGTVVVWPASSAPAGWLVCDGATNVVAGAYSNLFAVIGYNYGGSGSSFVLPDLRGRVPVGLNLFKGGRFATLRNSGGLEYVTLTIGQMPSHTHTFSGSWNASAETANCVYEGYGYSVPWISSDGYNFTVPATGGSQRHENMPPYLTMNYIIKYAFADGDIDGLATVLNETNTFLLWHMKILLWLFGALCAFLCAVLFFRT